MIFAQLEFGVVALLESPWLGVLPPVAVGSSLSLYIVKGFLFESFPCMWHPKMYEWVQGDCCNASTLLLLLRRRRLNQFTFIQQSSTVERLNNARVFLSYLWTRQSWMFCLCVKVVWVLLGHLFRTWLFNYLGCCNLGTREWISLTTIASWTWKHTSLMILECLYFSIQFVFSSLCTT